MNITNIYYSQLAVQRRDSASRRRGFNVQAETASICPGDGVPENRCLEGNSVDEEEGEEGAVAGGGEPQTGRQREGRTQLL